MKGAGLLPGAMVAKLLEQKRLEPPSDPAGLIILRALRVSRPHVVSDGTISAVDVQILAETIEARLIAAGHLMDHREVHAYAVCDLYEGLMDLLRRMYG